MGNKIAARTAEETFDTKPAIAQLEEASNWLSEALALAKEGTIPSLLKYYETGYTSGNWHFPTITTRYKHGIGHKLAKMLEDELLKDTGLHFRYKELGPQEWVLYYTNPDDVKENEPDYVWHSELVAMISIWTREINFYIHFGDKQKWLDERIKDCAKHIKKEVESIAEQEAWLQRYEKNLWVRLFRSRHLKKIQAYAPNFFEKKKQRIRMLTEDLLRFKKQKERFAALEQLIPIVNRFEKYGFTITPAKSEAEREVEMEAEHE